MTEIDFEPVPDRLPSGWSGRWRGLGSARGTTGAKAAVQRHPERITQSIMTTARDHGMDASSSDDGDSEADEMDTLHFKLRNAVATANGGGRPRAATRGNARFAAPFAAGLLLERGYILKRGDMERWLEWLEAEPFDAPDDAMWRSLMLVRETHHAGGRDAS